MRRLLLYRVVLLATALTVALCWRMDARADEQPSETAAERGYRHLIDTPFVPMGFDQEVFDNVWRVWPEALRAEAEKATPEERRRMAFERYGLTARPGDDSGRPLQFVVGEDGGWHTNCLSCHGGQVNGVVMPGLPNAHLALQTIVDDVRAAKQAIGRKLKPADFASAMIPFGKTVGTTNAVVFSFALLQFRDLDLNVIQPKEKLYLPHHDLDAPPWWHYRKRSHLYIDGSGKRGHRSLMQFLLVPMNGREQVLAFEPAFKDIEKYIESLRPPSYPFEIDSALAARGAAVFRKHCAGCHGTYGKDGAYPNRLVPIDKVGTDRVRLDAITKEQRTLYAKSWLTGYDPDGVRVDPGGYVAPSLDGIWASAPYFHNGAVPTLWHVLHSKARPAVWRRHPSDYDPERVGLRFDQAERVPATDDEHERRRWFDTTLKGKSAAGHTFPDRLTDEQRSAVLEYLKTL